MKRREFVKYGAASLFTLPFAISGNPPLYADNYASPIVSVLDKLATKISFKAGKVLNSDGVIVDKILSSEVNRKSVV